MSAREFSEWMAYYRLEPWGPERLELAIGILAALLANINRDPKKTNAYKPQDFMATYGEQPRQTVEQQVQLVEILAEAFGGTITREG